jgi:hypothetical protein
VALVGVFGTVYHDATFLQLLAAGEQPDTTAIARSLAMSAILAATARSTIAISNVTSTLHVASGMRRWMKRAAGGASVGSGEGSVEDGSAMSGATGLTGSLLSGSSIGEDGDDIVGYGAGAAAVAAVAAAAGVGVPGGGSGLRTLSGGSSGTSTGSRATSASGGGGTGAGGTGAGGMGFMGFGGGKKGGFMDALKAAAAGPSPEAPQAASPAASGPPGFDAAPTVTVPLAAAPASFGGPLSAGSGASPPHAGLTSASRSRAGSVATGAPLKRRGSSLNPE